MRSKIAVWLVLWLGTGCADQGTVSSGSNHAVTQTASFTAHDAIAKVLPQHPDFSATVGEMQIQKHNVGPQGSFLNGTMKTECQSVGPNTFHVIFTKAWQITVNGIPARSRWEYEVTPQSIRLLNAEDHADVFEMIK
jgi:hypothetical protein